MPLTKEEQTQVIVAYADWLYSFVALEKDQLRELGTKWMTPAAIMQDNEYVMEFTNQTLEYLYWRDQSVEEMTEHIDEFSNQVLQKFNYFEQIVQQTGKTPLEVFSTHSQHRLDKIINAKPYDIYHLFWGETQDYAMMGQVETEAGERLPKYKQMTHETTDHPATEPVPGHKIPHLTEMGPENTDHVSPVVEHTLCTNVHPDEASDRASVRKAKSGIRNKVRKFFRRLRRGAAYRVGRKETFSDKPALWERVLAVFACLPLGN